MASEREIEAAAHSIFGLEWHTKTHRAIARRALEVAERIRLEDRLEEFPILPPRVRRS